MAKNKILMIIGGVLLACFVFFGGAFGAYKIKQVKDFNDLVKVANQKFNTGNYDESIELYNEALQIKKDNDVIKNISMAQGNKQYSNIYNEGLKLVTEKKYSEAIQKLSTINQMAGQVYTNAQGKIEECKKNIISEDINATNTAISNKDYDGANKYVEDILKLDANNNDAKQLKTTIVQAQQKDKVLAQTNYNSNDTSNINTNNNSGDKKARLNALYQQELKELEPYETKLRLFKEEESILKSKQNVFPEGSEDSRAIVRRIMYVLKEEDELYKKLVQITTSYANKAKEIQNE